MNIYRVFVFLFVFLVLGCKDNNLDSYQIIDLNGDGKTDIFYEYDESGYYELMDRNFDKKIDVSTRYDLNDYVVESKSDDNFDGFLETDWFFENGFVSLGFVDGDYNKYYDLFFKYKDDVILYAEKFYASDVDNLSRIGRVNYKFGYPYGGEVFFNEGISEEEFHIRVLSKKELIKKNKKINRVNQ